MDARLSAEQLQLRDAAARLAADVGPGSVQDLADDDRVARLEKAVAGTCWRTLRSDGASAVEVAIVAEEFGRGLVDVPYAGPVLADDLRRAGGDPGGLLAAGPAAGADLTGATRGIRPDFDPRSELSADDSARWRALALVVTCADLAGAARGAHALACGYAKVRSQYGKTIGSYQAVAHPLAEGAALIEGSTSVLRHAAWAVDALAPAEAIRAAQIAKVYCARAALDICETAVQVHGGIGNTWECLAHVYLRRALTSTGLFPVALEEIDLGLQ